MLKVAHKHALPKDVSLAAGSRSRQLMHLRKWTKKPTASQPESCLGKTVIHPTRPVLWRVVGSPSMRNAVSLLIGKYQCQFGMLSRGIAHSLIAMREVFHATPFGIVRHVAWGSVAKMRSSVCL